MFERQLRNQEDRHKENVLALLQVRVEKDQLLESLKEKIEWFEVNLANSNEDLTSKNEALVKADEAAKRVIDELEHARERLKTVSDENGQLKDAQDHLKNRFTVRRKLN